ncbi:MAG: STT3 domain-containing protein [Spirochaetota bacterium]
MRGNELLLVIFVVAIILWFIVPFVTRDKNLPVFTTPDPFYHAHRVLITANNFPHVPSFDYYISYPDGAYCIWPPLFDFLPAFLIYIISAGKPNINQIEMVCGIYPVVWGLLVIFLTYKIAKGLLDRTTASISAFILAISPITSIYARFGYFDHHIAEVFGLLLIFYFLIKPDSNSYVKWLGLGLAFGVSLLLWQGSILFIGIAFFILIARREFNAFISYLIALIIILPFSINTHYVDSPFSYRGLSLLHISLLLIASLISLIFVLVKKKNILAIFSIVLLAFLVFFLLKSQSFMRGMFFIFKNDPWLATILEFKPLIIQSGYLDNLTVKRTFGPAYYVVPIMLLTLFLEYRIKYKSVINFYVFCLFTAVMSFIGVRYGIWFIPFFAILFAYFLKKVYSIFKGTIGILVSTILFFINLLAFQPKSYAAFMRLPDMEMVNACHWIKDSLPEAGNILLPHQKPQYGIMCFWDVGHYVVYIAGKPVTSSNFGNDAPNFKKVNEFYLTTSEDDALRYLNDFTADYVFLYGNIRNIYLASKYLEMNPADLLDLYYTNDKAGAIITIMQPKKLGSATTSYRLFQHLGRGFYEHDTFYTSYPHFRLRYFLKSIRVFELVKGAKIIGKTKPNMPVQINYEVTLPTINFVYFDSLSSDSAGNFSVVVPYASNNDRYYEISIGTKRKKVFVTEEDVRKGGVIYVD